MRIVIYHGPTLHCLATTPVGRGGVNAADGAQLDLDEVIGVGGFTVADALGDLVGGCTAPDPEPAPTLVRGRGRRNDVPLEGAEE